MWSIGESNPCSAKNMVATPHCGARFLFFEAGTDEISATGGHQFLPLSNAFSAISKSGMRTLRARINKSGHPRRVSGLFVEHRGVEPLTSTMRMSRATNCANAPYSIWSGANPCSASSMVVTPRCGDYSLSLDLSADKTSATGSCQRFALSNEMSRATNCANAPCASGSITQRKGKSKEFLTGQAVFDIIRVAYERKGER